MSAICAPSPVEEATNAPDTRWPETARKFQAPGRSLIEASFDELTEVMGGSGKASAIWKALREGSNPLEVPLPDRNPQMQGSCASLSSKARNHLRSFMLGDLDDWGQSVDDLLIPCAVEFESPSSDGTRKYLSTLRDGNRIESVLIPSAENRDHVDRTTLCVSTQIGCDRGCRFCATAKMGLIRNLTATEIIAQIIRGLHISKREGMPPLNNVVFMGMGDAGRNVDEVCAAVERLTDDRQLGMAASRVTVSTVGPSPEVFQRIARLPCRLAWSLHAADNALRKRLVPSTQHSIEELRDGLVQALKSSSSKIKGGVMIAATLIHDVNDSEEDAKRLRDFLRPVFEVAGRRTVVNLIPYNDIKIKGFTRPSNERITAFWKVLVEGGYMCTKRETRGDEESAACGMLKTKRDKADKKDLR